MTSGFPSQYIFMSTQYHFHCTLNVAVLYCMDCIRIYVIIFVLSGGMQIARFNTYALLFLKVNKISIQNYTFLESLLYQESTI